MKIGFATDTNILRKNNLSDCQRILDVTDMYTDYIESLNKIKSSHELIYYMPEIVVDELLMHFHLIRLINFLKIDIEKILMVYWENYQKII